MSGKFSERDAQKQPKSTFSYFQSHAGHVAGVISSTRGLYSIVENSGIYMVAFTSIKIADGKNGWNVENAAVRTT